MEEPCSIQGSIIHKHINSTEFRLGGGDEFLQSSEI